ncbi:hypothetical protein [Mesobacterium pallidum]|uniref:hypothetical protein n=1 Tax=Mesobacterium pallidum TaxID=2872037 RepID=UPI001EE29AD0|nr:hypothetical protein [Mesobacterium pallidum]
MGELSTQVWDRRVEPPGRLEDCEFIDLWTGARFARARNRSYRGTRERGWVWRGGLHQPRAVWKDEADDALPQLHKRGSSYDFWGMGEELRFEDHESALGCARFIIGLFSGFWGTVLLLSVVKLAG